jgi:hypothetical protein
MANLKYRGHLISVSVIFDTPSKYQFTPVVEGGAVIPPEF